MSRRIVSAYMIFRDVIHESIDDNIIKLSAALAYYTVFALPSLLLIVIGVCSIFYGRDAVEGTIFYDVSQFVGQKAALQIQETLKNTTLHGKNFFATTLGLVTLLIAATGIFGEIQDSINRIWGLKVMPKKGLIKFLRNRLISFSVIIALGFVLLVSLLVNAGVQMFIDRLKINTSDDFVDILVVLDYGLILVVTTVLFGFIFKLLPDARVKWRDVLAGSIFTAILFMLGKELITYYLSFNSSVTAYGAASSVIVLLLWVYFSSIILYVGAEFTQVWVRHRGRKIEPNRYAIWVEHDYIAMPSNTAIGDVKVLDEKSLKKEAEIVKMEKGKAKKGK